MEISFRSADSDLGVFQGMINRQSRRWFWAVFLSLVSALGAQEQVAVPPAGVGTPRYVAGRDFLFRSGPSYRNYGFEDYTLPELISYSRQNCYGIILPPFRHTV